MVSTSSNLPSPRRKEALRSIPPPLSNTRLNRLIYLLVLLATILTVYYGIRSAQWKVDEWSLALGMRPWHAPRYQNLLNWQDTKQKQNQVESVEDRVNVLAEILGVPRGELAAAVAVLVREHVSPERVAVLREVETGVVGEALGKTEKGPMESGVCL